MKILVIDVFEERRLRIERELRQVDPTVDVMSLSTLAQVAEIREPDALLVHGGNTSTGGIRNRGRAADCIPTLARKDWTLPVIVYSGGGKAERYDGSALLTEGRGNRTVWCTDFIDEGLPAWKWNLGAWLQAVRAGEAWPNLHAALHDIDTRGEEQLAFLWAASAALAGDMARLDQAIVVAAKIQNPDDARMAAELIEKAKRGDADLAQALVSLRDKWFKD